MWVYVGEGDPVGLKTWWGKFMRNGWDIRTNETVLRELMILFVWSFTLKRFNVFTDYLGHVATCGYSLTRSCKACHCVNMFLWFSFSHLCVFPTVWVSVRQFSISPWSTRLHVRHANASPSAWQYGGNSQTRLYIKRKTLRV